MNKSPVEMDIAIGNKIRSARIYKGLSQSDLADSVGITFQQIQKYEKATNRVSASRLQKIANALDVNILEFFQYDNCDDNLFTKENLNYLSEFNKLNSEYKLVVTDFIKTLAKKD